MVWRHHVYAKVLTMTKLIKLFGLSALIAFTVLLALGGIIIFTKFLLAGLWLTAVSGFFVMLTFVFFLTFLIANIVEKNEKHVERQQ